ncbi:MAG TPA: hypothetical protein IAC71_07610 [Candidatus Caccomonas pullistercoris]|nr:hypothetical protein [Candidatus Caccomonas pullistercoris]
MRTFKYTINGKALSVRVDEKQGTIADILVDGVHPAVPDEEMPVYAAVISLALIEHEVEIVHDEEPGVITLAPSTSVWGNVAGLLMQQ